MSYANFKLTIWSKYIQTQLPKFTIFENDCNYQFKGEVGKGKTVKILGVGRPTIGNYDGSDIGAPEAVNDSAVNLLIDQAKYFNFSVDDVDEAQSIDGLMSALMEESTRAMAEQRDTFLAELCATGAGTLSSTTDVSSAATAKAAIDLALVALYDNGVPMNGDITIYLNPMVYMWFQEYIMETKQQNDALIANGVLGTYSGAKIKMSNNFYNDSADDYLIVKTGKAVAFASCIESVEAYRPEGFFSDAIKGLNTYGGKAVRPNEIYIIKAH